MHYVIGDIHNNNKKFEEVEKEVRHIKLILCQIGYTKRK